MKFKYYLGLRVKTKVAEFEGILVSRSENLFGCNRYYIQPRVNKDMKVPDGWWVDEDDIIVIGEGVTAKGKDTGGLMSKIN